ncbi:MAG TPA: RagB/SusD family nutrient uptake outer membrane protein [Flavisolibacter sp.]|nr:RagB/SusD family nutrient uptake outer membrane protein [Flavisolibacter sp.]
MKSKNIIIFFSAVLLLSACKKDFLNKVPYTSIPSETAIVDESSMQAAVAGVYRGLNGALFASHLIIMGDILADNVYQALPNSNRYTAAFQLNYNSNSADVLAMWTQGYVAIGRANNVINSTIASSPVTNNLKGEALTLRALSYLSLVQYFAKPYTSDPNGAGIPIVTTFEPQALPARNTTAEVYALIEKDLTEAFALITVAKNTGFVNKYAPKALLARMHLVKGEWQKAKDAALDVITNGGYTLVSAPNFAAYWKNPAVKTDKVETIFELNQDAVVNAGNNNSAAYLFDQAGYGDILSTEELYNLYNPADVRRTLIISGTRNGANVRIVNKYSNASSTDKDNIKVVRVAEMYLTIAEASYRLNDEATALTYLNSLVENRIPGFTGYSSTGAALLEDIIKERRLELAFEGMRYLDLQRLNRDITRTNLNGNYPANVPLVFAFSNHRRVLPIPLTETDANPNIVQNPNYN